MLSTVKQIMNYLVPIAIGIVLALGCQRWVMSSAEVISGSMVPTLPYPTYLLVDKIAVEVAKPYRGEVIMFHPPKNSIKEDPLLKRIIGMPGDTIEIHDGNVFVNKKPLHEPYLHVTTLGTWGPFHVPQNEYFVLGDNRNNSLDSRYWNNPFVPRQNIIGRIDAVVWPLTSAKFVH